MKNMKTDDSAPLEALMRRFSQAQEQRAAWEPIWGEAYNFALPQRNGFSSTPAGGRQTDHLYDATALDAAEKLAASLLGNLTPPWTQWFGFKPGPDLTPREAERLAPVLEKAAKTVQAQFDRSNFIVEMHQCFLDLVVGGTAALYLEETDPGSFSAFRFSSVPLNRIMLGEGADGFLNGR